MSGKEFIWPVERQEWEEGGEVSGISGVDKRVGATQMGATQMGMPDVHTCVMGYIGCVRWTGAGHCPVSHNCVRVGTVLVLH